jgi:hypothetical protein
MLFSRTRKVRTFVWAISCVLAKNATTFDTNKFNFVLLADPALATMAFPKAFCQDTLSINNSVTGKVDSVRIGALEKVTINGEVSLEGWRQACGF